MTDNNIRLLKSKNTVKNSSCLSELALSNSFTDVNNYMANHMKNCKYNSVCRIKLHYDNKHKHNDRCCYLDLALYNVVGYGSLEMLKYLLKYIDDDNVKWDTLWDKCKVRNNIKWDTLFDSGIPNNDIEQYIQSKVVKTNAIML